MPQSDVRSAFTVLFGIQEWLLRRQRPSYYMVPTGFSCPRSLQTSYSSVVWPFTSKRPGTHSVSWQIHDFLQLRPQFLPRPNSGRKSTCDFKESSCEASNLVYSGIFILELEVAIRQHTFLSEIPKFLMLLSTFSKNMSASSVMRHEWLFMMCYPQHKFLSSILDLLT